MTPSATPTPLCVGAAGIDLTHVTISKNGSPIGDEQLRARGRVQLTTLIPAVDPIANGFTFALTDAHGTLIFSRSIPGGQAPDLRTPGWRVNSGHTRWTFRDSTATVAGGITSVVISDQPNVAPGRYSFALKGHGTFQVLPAEVPVQLIAIFGAEPQRAAGQCGQRLFNPNGAPPPRCTLLRSGGLLSCR